MNDYLKDYRTLSFKARKRYQARIYAMQMELAMMRTEMLKEGYPLWPQIPWRKKGYPHLRIDKQIAIRIG